MNNKYLLIFLFIALLALIYIHNQSQTRISAEEKAKEESVKTCDYFSYNGDIVVPATGPTNNINNVTPVAMPCVVLANTENNRKKLTELKINFLGGLDSKKEDVIIIPGATINPGKGGDVINIPESKKTIDLGILDRVDIDLSADFTINIGSGNNQIHIQPVFKDGTFGNLSPCKKPIKPTVKGGYCILYTVLKNNEVCNPPECAKDLVGPKSGCIKDYYRSDVDITKSPNKLSDKFPAVDAKRVNEFDNIYEIVACGSIKNGELVFGGDLSKYINSGIIQDGDTTYGYYGGIEIVPNPTITKIKINQEACPKKPKLIPIDDDAMSSLPNNISTPPPPPATF